MNINETKEQVTKMREANIPLEGMTDTLDILCIVGADRSLGSHVERH
jgi:hypothetical protein